MPKHSFSIEAILEADGGSRARQQPLASIGHDDYRGYKKRTLTAMSARGASPYYNNNQTSEGNNNNNNGNNDSSSSDKSPPAAVKPEPSMSLSPASSFTSSASSTNSHTPEDSTTAGLKQQSYFKSLMTNSYMASSASEPAATPSYPSPDLALFLTTLLQQSSGQSATSNPYDDSQFAHQQHQVMLNYAKIFQTLVASMANPLATQSSSDHRHHTTNDQSSMPTASSAKRARLNESSGFFTASSLPSHGFKNVYKLDENKLKQEPFANGSPNAQIANYFMNNLNSVDSKQTIKSEKMQHGGSGGMSPPTSGDDCSTTSSIENVSPLEALRNLANTTFVSCGAAGLAVSGDDEIKPNVSDDYLDQRTTSHQSHHQTTRLSDNNKLSHHHHHNRHQSTSTAAAAAAAATSSSSHNSSFESTLNSGSMRSHHSTNSSSPLIAPVAVHQPLLHHPIASHPHHHHPPLHSHHTSTSSSLSSSTSTTTTTTTTTTSSSSSSSLKRKRKNRTAFNANQLYALERRFSAQRYLSPHDRDRIAAELALTAGQVITWFQNRRAKQKRDIEEMKNDVTAAKNLKIIDADIDVDKVVQYEAFKYHHSQAAHYPPSSFKSHHQNPDTSFNQAHRSHDHHHSHSRHENNADFESEEEYEVDEENEQSEIDIDTNSQGSSVNENEDGDDESDERSTNSVDNNNNNNNNNSRQESSSSKKSGFKNN